MKESNLPGGNQESHMQTAALSDAEERRPVRRPPKNGRYWVALLVGGPPAIRGLLIDKLSGSYGILIKHHREQLRHAHRSDAIPRDVDVVIYIRSIAGHIDGSVTKRLAGAAGIPFVACPHKWTFVKKALERNGFLPDQPRVQEKIAKTPMGLLSLLRPTAPPPAPAEPPPEEVPVSLPTVPVVVADLETGPVEVRQTPTKLIIELPKSATGIPDTFMGCVALIREFMKGANVKSIMLSGVDVAMEFNVPMPTGGETA